MPVTDLSPLIGAKSEDLGVEYKAWMDTSDSGARAALARHLAALHNHGGGYLIFGVDDKTKAPLGVCPFPSPAKTYGEDAISAIVKRYLEPPFQCKVVWSEHDGQDYPVVIVPPHAARPAIAKSDGPPDAKGKPIGITEGSLYIRVPGPASERIRRPDDWAELLDRLLQHRADKLETIMRRALATPRAVDPDITELLKTATETAIGDYLTQVAAALPTDGDKRKHHLAQADTAFAAIGYALVNADGALVAIPDPRALNDAVAVQIRSYAYRGWAHFLPLTTPDRAPQLRPDTIAGRETNYLEGMRIENANVLFGEVDYWRIYDLGLAVTVSSYREDYVASRHGRADRYLDVRSVLIKLHSALAHARFVAQGLGDVASIVVRLDWRDIAGRTLRLGDDGMISPGTPAAERFLRTVTLPWALLRDDYAQALARLAQPLFSVFNLPADYQTMVLEPKFIADQFAPLGSTFRLIPDNAA